MKWTVRTLSGLCLAACLIFLSAISVTAHQVALKKGQIIEFETYWVTEGTLHYTDGAGKEVKVALNDIDFDRTRELSTGDKPSLDLPGLSLTGPPQLKTENLAVSTKSLGEIAREARASQPAKRGASNEQSWMEQGLVNTQQQSNANQGTEKSTDYRQLQIMNLSCGELGAAVLQSKNPNLDILFPGRSSWELELCQARNAWKLQYDRYAAHKGNQGEMEEEKRASDLWEAFQDRAYIGIGQAILARDKKN